MAHPAKLREVGADAFDLLDQAFRRRKGRQLRPHPPPIRVIDARQAEIQYGGILLIERPLPPPNVAPPRFPPAKFPWGNMA
ncbi:hypothetical protein Cni_G20575 [Canna indica]|uniref:Uncharacterized protein n=1 Tax=Canna indica TaxID=4628 RepID=A0AAQ3QGC6_9LILI|nr:hypothetical protein Cni_G20575 [Canna indica]